MPFVATIANTGVPDFGIVHIDAEQVALAFQAYLVTGSQLTGVSLDEISTGVTALPDNVANVTLSDLVARGMKLFDAVVWITAGRPTSHPLVIDGAMKSEDVPSMQVIAKSVFYCYFLLLTQARYPSHKEGVDKVNIPNFLRTIMGLDKAQETYVETICTFDPRKFDPKWVRHVKFTGFGQEVLSRFGLGVAGYRMFGPFNLYQPKAGISDNLKAAVEFATNVSRANASWNIHPLTRNPNILKNRGNLNKNLGNLILEVFDDIAITEMITTKVIYARPVRDPNHRNYRSWSPIDDISPGADIF